MAYTEKVSLNATALSFLFYECINSTNSQEGFLIGDVTSQISNHISDSQNDSARLDTQILIRTVLPLPSVSLFYLPTGTIREDIITEILANAASEVVGWYKYRRSSSIKPTFRDKLISKGLKKYFEKYHGRKHFVTCNLSTKASSASSTHTLIYRFGKINCFDMYTWIDDVTTNLGEKLTGYKRPLRLLPHCVFNKIVKESNVRNNNTNDAILHIQEAVDVRLVKEAKIAAKNEYTIRELEAEIKQISAILCDKQAVDLQTLYQKMVEEKFIKREQEMAEACVEVLKTPSSTVDIFNVPNVMVNDQNFPNSDSNSVELIENDAQDRSPSPVLMTTSSIKHPTVSYAATLRKGSDVASTSKTTVFNEDLITFDEDKIVKKPIRINDNVKCSGDSSPEY